MLVADSLHHVVGVFAVEQAGQGIVPDYPVGFGEHLRERIVIGLVLVMVIADED